MPAWGVGDWWYHSEAFLSFSPRGPSAEQGGRVLRKSGLCPLSWAFVLHSKTLLCARDLVGVTSPHRADTRELSLPALI